jgi:hypothetical protein
MAAATTYQIRELFGKCFLPALLIVATKSTYLDFQPNWFQSNGGIPHQARVAAVIVR